MDPREERARNRPELLSVWYYDGDVDVFHSKHLHYADCSSKLLDRWGELNVCECEWHWFLPHVPKKAPAKFHSSKDLENLWKIWSIQGTHFCFADTVGGRRGLVRWSQRLHQRRDQILDHWGQEGSYSQSREDLGIVQQEHQHFRQAQRGAH